MLQLSRYSHTDTWETIESVRSNWVQCGEEVRPFFSLGQSKLSTIKNRFVCYIPLVFRSRYKQFRALSKWFWGGVFVFYIWRGYVEKEDPDQFHWQLKILLFLKYLRSRYPFLAIYEWFWQIHGGGSRWRSRRSNVWVFLPFCPALITLIDTTSGVNIWKPFSRETDQPLCRENSESVVLVKSANWCFTIWSEQHILSTFFQIRT